MAQRASWTFCWLSKRPGVQSNNSDYAAFALKRISSNVARAQGTEGHITANQDFAVLERSFQQETTSSPVDLLKAALLGPPHHLSRLGPSWSGGTGQTGARHDSKWESAGMRRIENEQVEALKTLEKFEQRDKNNLRKRFQQIQAPDKLSEHAVTSLSCRHTDGDEQTEEIDRLVEVEVQTTSTPDPVESADREPDLDMDGIGVNRPKLLRSVMRNQLHSCEQSRDILKVVAHAVQRRDSAIEIGKLYGHFQSAFYRVRASTSDPRILATINTIISRFRSAGIKIDDDWLTLGLKFAARSRSLPAMKRYLQEHRSRGLQIRPNNFRSVIAKFSIGQRGLGEIRNGRWKKSELLQVLKGFPDVNDEKACHLETFLDRDDWRMYHAWIAVLARCRAVDELLTEWELWKKSKLRSSKKSVPDDAPFVYQSAKLRGDRWFIEQLFLADEPQIAWRIFKESGMSFEDMRPPLSGKMLGHAEYATVWNDAIAKAMMDKYANDLVNIERALGVRWVPDGADGYHVPVECDLEGTLERLADPNHFKTFGYPVEIEPETVNDYIRPAVPSEDSMDHV